MGSSSFLSNLHPPPPFGHLRITDKIDRWSFLAKTCSVVIWQLTWTILWLYPYKWGNKNVQTECGTSTIFRNTIFQVCYSYPPPAVFKPEESITALAKDIVHTNYVISEHTSHCHSQLTFFPPDVTFRHRFGKVGRLYNLNVAPW